MATIKQVGSITIDKDLNVNPENWNIDINHPLELYDVMIRRLNETIAHLYQQKDIDTANIEARIAAETQRDSDEVIDPDMWNAL